MSDRHPTHGPTSPSGPDRTDPPRSSHRRERLRIRTNSRSSKASTCTPNSRPRIPNPPSLLSTVSWSVESLYRGRCTTPGPRRVSTKCRRRGEFQLAKGSHDRWGNQAPRSTRTRSDCGRTPTTPPYSPTSPEKRSGPGTVCDRTLSPCNFLEPEISVDVYSEKWTTDPPGPVQLVG